MKFSIEQLDNGDWILRRDEETWDGTEWKRISSGCRFASAPDAALTLERVRLLPSEEIVNWPAEIRSYLNGRIPYPLFEKYAPNGTSGIEGHALKTAFVEASKAMDARHKAFRSGVIKVLTLANGESLTDTELIEALLAEMKPRPGWKDLAYKLIYSHTPGSMVADRKPPGKQLKELSETELFKLLLETHTDLFARFNEILSTIRGIL